MEQKQEEEHGKLQMRFTQTLIIKIIFSFV